jgi:hypothetical protein
VWCVGARALLLTVVWGAQERGRECCRAEARAPLRCSLTWARSGRRDLVWNANMYLPHAYCTRYCQWQYRV